MQSLTYIIVIIIIIAIIKHISTANKPQPMPILLLFDQLGEHIANDLCTPLRCALLVVLKVDMCLMMAMMMMTTIMYVCMLAIASRNAHVKRLSI